MSDCINLRERFGDRYKIGLDPAAEVTTVGRCNDPWMFTIPCRYGTIFPHGGDTLAAEVDGHPLLTRPLLAIPGVRLYQDGDREKTFLFDANLFDEVAKIIRPHRLPRMSEEQRQAAIDRLAKHQFKPAAPGHRSERRQGATAEGGQNPV